MDKKVLHAITGSGLKLNQYAKAYIDKILLTRSLSTMQKKAINDFVVYLLAYNSTNANFFRPDSPSDSILRGFYPLWWESYNATKYNLVNPIDAEVLTEVSAMTYNAAGAKASNVNLVGLETPFYCDDLPLYSSTLGNYPYENNMSAGNDIGALATLSSMDRMRTPGTSNNFLSTKYGSDGQVITAITDSLGLFISSRTSRTVHKGYKNGVQIGSTNTSTIVNITPPHLKIALCGVTGAGGTPRGQSLGLLGKGMSDAEVLYLNNGIQKLKADLGLLNYFFLEADSYLYANSYLS